MMAGRKPRLDVHLLRAYEAQIADNARLWKGGCYPWFADLGIDDTTVKGIVKTIYFHGRTNWLTYNADVDVTRSPISENTDERIYLSGLDMPRQTDLTSYPTTYPLGLARPVKTPSLTLGTGGTGSARGITYVCTFVSKYGEESAPSSPSAVIQAKEGQLVIVSNLDQAVPAGYENYITKKRIYRLLSGITGEDYKFLVELSLGTGFYNDTVLDTGLGGTLETDTWIPPPAALKGLSAHPASFLVGFKDNTVFCSELNAHYAFPLAYQYNLEYPIVALGIAGASIIVATTSFPYILRGQDPATLSKHKLESYKEPCLSKRSFATYGAGAVWASPRGLFKCDAGGRGALLTHKIIDEETWREFFPNRIHGEIHNERYYGWYDTGIIPGEVVVDEAFQDGVFNEPLINGVPFNGRSAGGTLTRYDNYKGRGFIFDVDEPQAKWTEIPFYIHAAYSDPEARKLYYFTESSDKARCIAEWEGDRVRYKSYKWRSGLVRTKPAAMSAAKCYIPPGTFVEQSTQRQGIAPLNEAAFNVIPFAVDAYDTTTSPVHTIFRYYGGEKLIHEETVTDEKPFRFPVDDEHAFHELEIEGKLPVTDIRIAETVPELAEDGP